jgi:hypothetical protein
MVPFRREDARFFHGRDAEIQNLLTLVRQHHFLAVVGSSGSGKSSLITAGLLPRLDDTRNFPRGTWRILSLRLGATPLEELARVLGGPPDDPAAAVAQTLAADPPAQRLLLIVDQFEELFSQVKAASTRDAFIGHLKALRADPRCTVLLTMRADFYGDLMNSPLWPIDKSQLVEVAALRGDALRQAIVKPAEAVGVYLEEGLVERLLADAANEPGALPMLQEAMVLLWGTMSGRLLTRASYDALGTTAAVAWPWRWPPRPTPRSPRCRPTGSGSPDGSSSASSSSARAGPTPVASSEWTTSAPNPTTPAPSTISSNT